jgi:hypothetical protein
MIYAVFWNLNTNFYDIMYISKEALPEFLDDVRIMGFFTNEDRAKAYIEFMEDNY